MASKLRDDLESLKVFVARMGGSGLQATTFAGITASDGNYPTAAGAFYLVHPLTVGGDEVEGAAWTSTANVNQSVYAYNMGATAPPVGTKVLVFHVPNRWVFFHG